MKAILNGGPLDGGTAEVSDPEGARKGQTLIISHYCPVAHRFLDHKYIAESRPKEGKQQFKWKGQKN
jgi:hypothetical protein